MSKSRKILNEIGDQISAESREAILSIDRMERELAALKGEKKPEQPKLEPKPEPKVESKPAAEPEPEED